MDSNLILERAGRVSKWPKCKSRLIHDESSARFDPTIIPTDEKDAVRDNKASSSPHTQGERDPLLDVVDISQDTLNRPDLQDAEIGGESDLMMESVHSIMFLPKGNRYHAHPDFTLKSLTQITFPEHPARMTPSIHDCAPLYFTMNCLLPVPNVFLTQDRKKGTESPNRSKEGKGEVKMLDGEIVDSFGPSRLPPRIIFLLPGARKAVEKEINDLLTPHGTEPPSMVVV